jgi:hypothetical protein
MLLYSDYKKGKIQTKANFTAKKNLTFFFKQGIFSINYAFILSFYNFFLHFFTNLNLKFFFALMYALFFISPFFLQHITLDYKFGFEFLKVLCSTNMWFKRILHYNVYIQHTYYYVYTSSAEGVVRHYA